MAKLKIILLTVMLTITPKLFLVSQSYPKTDHSNFQIII